MQEVYIFGSGGHGKVVASVLLAQGITPKGFLDEDPRRTGKSVLGIPIAGGWEILQSPSTQNSLAVIAALGENQQRKRVFEELRKKGIAVLSAVHPSAIFDPSVQIGEGATVLPGVIVNVDSRIGENTIVNTGVSVDHDCRVGDHVHLAPGCVLAGGVIVEEGAFLGVGVRVVPGVRIGAWATVGAGAVVLNDVPSGQTVAGVPAKALP